MHRVRSILAEGVALALLAAAVGGDALVTPARAQDAGANARGTLAPTSDPLTRSSQPLPGLSSTPGSRNGAADVTSPDAAGPGATTAEARRRLSLRARQRATRRTRPPTVQPVRAQVRAETTSREVNKTVQVPVIGLPDPLLPGRASLTDPILPGRSGLPDPTLFGASGLLVPLALPRRPGAEADPYASVGLKSGGLIFFPALEQGIGYDSNPNREATPRSGSLWTRTDGQLRVASIWSTHELTADLRGGYSAFPNTPEADRPDGVGNVRLRIDAARDARIDAEARYLFETQRPGSPELNAPAAERSLIATTGASLEGTKSFNRLSVGLRGSFDRVVYEDVRLPNGTVVPQGDRDQNTYSLRLRTSYELKPGFTPFADVLVDNRIYDLTTDFAGFRRNSVGTGFRVGSTFELARTVTGEVSAGYQMRRFDDPRLRDANGPVAQAALTWAATPLTAVRLQAQTDIAETTVPGASSILSRRATLELQHDFRRNLRLTLAGTALENAYQGANIRETGYSLGAKLDYRLTRWLALRASYLHERLSSNVPSSSFTADSVLVGLRLQP